MVIAAYAGCGKTTFASKVWNSIDMVCVPYKYIVTDELEEADAESKKGDYGYEMNPDWPGNYISAVLTAYHRYKYVVIPTVPEVLRELQRFRVPYILCYPDRGLQEEYRIRYKDRGNPEVFETIFIDGWDRYLDIFEADDVGDHIVLKSQDYLLSRVAEIEQITDKRETVTNVIFDDYVEEDIKRIFEETGVCIEEHLRQFLMYLVENEDLLNKWKTEGMVEILKEYKMMSLK